MKQIPVDECPAGVEIDAAVAKAIGWQKITIGPGAENKLMASGRDLDNRIRVVLQFSQDIEAAWELWEDVKKKVWADFIDELEWRADTSCTFDVLRYITPLTITRAYLKAKGVEFVEVPEVLCDD